VTVASWRRPWFLLAYFACYRKLQPSLISPTSESC
jgi:hypothetical protein